ncbi:MAG: S-layer homology domain-containing protein [Candidatus Aquicultor sp.]|nr:S-layer homology domain-containing protein [Candidatus Aquicultor sp.]
MHHSKYRIKRSAWLLFFTLSLIFAFAAQAAAETVIPIVFPVEGSCSFTDTFGAPRGTTRTHEGIDIMAAKMTPLVAAVDGVVSWLNNGEQTSTANGLPYYNLMLKGDDGNAYYYVHLNNDIPGTDDGMGGPQNAYAPGIVNGSRVAAGQHIAYVGDSGNAEESGSHVHFEIHQGGYKNPINPYPSLMAAKAGLFKDIGTDDWCFQYIFSLVKKGVVTGYGDGTFKPTSAVTRAEFIKMVVTASGIDTLTVHNGYFPDVSSAHWVSPYVEAAKESNIISGDAAGNFRPDVIINRAEAAEIVVNAAGANENASGDLFSDVASDFWAYVPIMTARNSGIINGYPDGTFRPTGNASRAESTKIIFSICP